VEEREEEIVVTRRGKPAAVLVNYGEYERLKDTLEILSDAELMRQIRRSRRFYGAGGTGLSLDQVFDVPSRPPKRRAR
jgi:PHD/YefM family antitoxin component YafN of YafNO toxin-antitoxin module